MTYIGALKSPKTAKEQHIVCIADSMSSNQYTKSDNAQKLFHVGDCLIMGTGMGSYIQDTAVHLQGKAPTNIEDAANETLKITDTMGLNEKDGLAFIIAGPSSSGLHLVSVDPTGIRGKNGPNYSERGFVAADSFFDGSGAPHASTYAALAAKIGKTFPRRSIADDIMISYTLASEGATDTGVNRAIQLAVMTPDGISTLYQPQVNPLNPVFRARHAQDMLGVRISSEWELEKVSKWMDQFEVLGLVSSTLGEFYHALITDIERVKSVRESCTYVGEKFFSEDGATMEDIERIKGIRESREADLKKDVDAFMKRGLTNIRAAITRYQGRRKEEMKALEG